MFCAKKRPAGVAVTDLGEIFPETESIRESSRCANGTVDVVVVGGGVVVLVVVAGAAVVVVVGAAVDVEETTSVVVVATGEARTSDAWP